jgi:phthiocerol/phenolphthiocerol synthesis type-I polyketide synthase C
MSDGAIAIVGASCRFPGAAGLKAFWRLLIDGVDAVSDVGAQRWSTRFFYHPTRGEPGKTYSWAAGLIDDIDRFEPGFFGISPREAAEMDPQQRLLLELAWHALEDAGIPAARLGGSATGVYIGASSTDYGDLRLSDPASGDQHFLTGISLSILANRVSHVFDLRGPSLVVDTACSSSLVALHEACEALRANRVDAALVGGINLLLSPYPFIGFAQAGMLSRRGRCFAFDERADGYVRGEGGAVVVLKRLGRAGRSVCRCRAGRRRPNCCARSMAPRGSRRRRSPLSRCMAPARPPATPSKRLRSAMRLDWRVPNACRSARSRPISAIWNQRRGWPGC